MRIIKYYLCMFVLFIGIFSINVQASESNYVLNLGKINEFTTEKANDVTYEYFDITDKKSNPQKVFLAKFDPKNPNLEMVLHDMHPGIGQFNKHTVMEIALDYEKKTGRKVYAAVNGDFFGSSGVLCNYYIKDGQVIFVGGSSMSTFGFNNSGNYAIGIPTHQPKLRIYDENDKYQEFFVDKFNGQQPNNNEIAVFKPGEVMSTDSTGKYLVTASPATVYNKYTLPLKGDVYRPIVGEVTTDEDITVPDGYFGIAINASSEDNNLINTFYNALTNNTKVEIFNAPKGEFEKMKWVIGGNNKLVVENRVMPEPLKLGSAGDGTAPRSTIGIMNDGSFFVMIIDGRNSSYSVGVTVPEQAQLARDLGAFTAMELDGGGSSTFILRVNDELQILNQPSDSLGPRSVSNAVLIVEREKVENTDPIDNPNDNNSDNTKVDDNNKEPMNLLIPIVSASAVFVIVILGTVVLIKKKR